MRYIPWLLVALCAIALIWFLANQTIPVHQVGLIDIGRILTESPQAQRLNQQLSEKYEQLVAQLQAEDEELDEVAKAERERTIYAEYLRFRQELENQFQAALNKAIAEVAEAENLQLVLDEDLVRYGGRDISNEVIKRLQ